MKNDTMTAAKAMAIELSQDTLSNMQDINGTLTVGSISPVFQTHFVNLRTGEVGIADLICKILRENDSVFPAGSADSELRPIAIAGSMFTCEILAKVQELFTAGSTRYAQPSVKAYLSAWLQGNEKQVNRNAHPARIGKIQLKGIEDQPRPCNRPRCKWYLLQNASK